MRMETRVLWIDTCRGIALLMVVIDHMGIPVVGKGKLRFCVGK